MDIIDATLGKTVKYLRAPLDRAHLFYGAERTYACRLTRVTLYHHQSQAAGFELDARFDADTYAAIKQAGAFELCEANQGALFGGSLQADAPVHVTLFLRHDLLRSHFSSPGAFAAEVNGVLSAIATPAHPLARVDSWVFVSVLQDVPGQDFQVGFKHRSYEEMDQHLLL